MSNNIKKHFICFLYFIRLLFILLILHKALSKIWQLPANSTSTDNKWVAFVIDLEVFGSCLSWTTIFYPFGDPRIWDCRNMSFYNAYEIVNKQHVQQTANNISPPISQSLVQYRGIIALYRYQHHQILFHITII